MLEGQVAMPWLVRTFGSSLIRTFAFPPTLILQFHFIWGNLIACAKPDTFKNWIKQEIFFPLLPIPSL